METQDSEILLPRDARILITGGTGSWGTELTRQLLERHSPAEIRIYSRGEQKQVEMKRTFSGRSELAFIIGDVRDRARLMDAARDVDIVFHLAALKHVPVCEENPFETVKTNILGTQNLIDAASANGVGKFILVSTDKAVDPFNLYGITKACAEKLVIAANLLSGDTRFSCIRAGNVLGTNGSVVPLFRAQLEQTDVITITDPRMTRFFMRVSDAIRLVIAAAERAVGGEIAVIRMPACRIVDLAEVMIETLGGARTKVRTIGIRPGEKIHEVLVSRNERDRTKLNGGHYVILPQIDLPATSHHYADYDGMREASFTSENAYRMNKEEIFTLLEKDGCLEPSRGASPVPAEKLRLTNPFQFEGWRPHVRLPAKTVICGGQGDVGRVFQRLHPDAIPLDKREMDITRPDSIREALLRHKPRYVVNAAGLGDIAACELNREQCRLLNVTGVRYLAELCREAGVRLVQISTDQAVDPVNEYGRCKMESDRIAGADGVVFRASIYTESHYIPRHVLRGERARLYDNVERHMMSAASFVDEIVPFFDASGIVDLGASPPQTMYAFGLRLARRFHADAANLEAVPYAEGEEEKAKSLRSLLRPQNILDPEEDVDRFYYYYHSFLS